MLGVFAWSRLLVSSCSISATTGPRRRRKHGVIRRAGGSARAATRCGEEVAREARCLWPGSLGSLKDPKMVYIAWRPLLPGVEAIATSRHLLGWRPSPGWSPLGGSAGGNRSADAVVGGHLHRLLEATGSGWQVMVWRIDRDVMGRTPHPNSAKVPGLFVWQKDEDEPILNCSCQGHSFSLGDGRRRIRRPDCRAFLRFGGAWPWSTTADASGRQRPSLPTFTVFLGTEL